MSHDANVLQQGSPRTAIIKGLATS